MIKNVQLKRVNKILDVDYYLISSAILLFVSIKDYDLGTSSIIYIYAYSIYIGVYKYIVLHYN